MIQLHGQQLTLEQIADIAHGREQVMLAAERACASSSTPCGREHRRRETHCLRREYRFWQVVRRSHRARRSRQLQLNLVRSHACGSGDPLSEPEARAMLLLRANVLACGFSGARPLVIDTLIAMLESGVTPVIPEKGSVGASGDLAPLAHLALAAIGEGEVFYKGERLAAPKRCSARNRATPAGSQRRSGAAQRNAGDGRRRRTGSCIALNSLRALPMSPARCHSKR